MITTTNNWNCGFKSFFFFLKKVFLLSKAWSFNNTLKKKKAEVENGHNKSWKSRQAAKLGACVMMSFTFPA